MDETEGPLISFVAVAYRRYRMLPVLVHSLLAQSDDRWELLVIHDGPDPAHEILGRDFAKLDRRISYSQSSERLGQFGHPLRAAGLELVRAPWVVLTNDDNYYCPTFVEKVLTRIKVKRDLSVVAVNMVHSHRRDDYAGRNPPKEYGLLEVQPKRCFCDVGAFAARTDLARMVGFKGTEHDSDGDYLEAVLEAGRRRGLFWERIPQILFVHN